MSDQVMIFTPAPQLTVTIEQPADHTEIHLHPGGQGIWQARMLSALGSSVAVCASVGGEIGRVLAALIPEHGIELHTVSRASSSGGYVHDRREGERVELADVPGAPLTRHELDELYGLALAHGLSADVSILSGAAAPGIVPADTYRRLATDLAGGGSRVVVDLSGDDLTAALEGRPAFVKVSHEELLRDGRAADDSDEAMVDTLYRLRDEGAGAVLISRADEPALALVDDRVVEVHMPRLEATDTRGAGDSMTAGVASVLARGGGLDEALRTGAAAGAVNVTRHGLGTGRADVVEQLRDRVDLRPRA